MPGVEIRTRATASAYHNELCVHVMVVPFVCAWRERERKRRACVSCGVRRRHSENYGNAGFANTTGTRELVLITCLGYYTVRRSVINATDVRQLHNTYYTQIPMPHVLCGV